jgi:hypothetical protein
MDPSYSFLQFGLLALAAEFEFSVEIPMPAQVSLASWPISAHYSLLPLPARKPRTGPVGLPACATHSACFPRSSPTSGYLQQRRRRPSVCATAPCDDDDRPPTPG